MPSLCVFSKPYIQGLCDPVGRIASYIHFIYPYPCIHFIYTYVVINPLLLPLILRYVFVELMKSAAFSVEFSFNNTMYKETDGVAMGSPLGPALANIFDGYYEVKLFSQTQKPPTYFRYVDTFAIFNHESFSSPKLKISLISTLVHRALMICTKRRLNEEIERIKKILLDNGYPRNVINTQIAKKIARFYTLKRFGPEKCPVYLRVLGLVSPPQTWKKKSKPPWKAAMVPLAPAWSYVNAHAACGPQGCSTCYSYMNINATVIVGT